MDKTLCEYLTYDKNDETYEISRAASATHVHNIGLEPEEPKGQEDVPEHSPKDEVDIEQFVIEMSPPNQSFPCDMSEQTTKRLPVETPSSISKGGKSTPGLTPGSSNLPKIEHVSGKCKGKLEHIGEEEKHDKDGEIWKLSKMLFASSKSERINKRPESQSSDHPLARFYQKFDTLRSYSNLATNSHSNGTHDATIQNSGKGNRNTLRDHFYGTNYPISDGREVYIQATREPSTDANEPNASNEQNQEVDDNDCCCNKSQCRCFPWSKIWSSD